MRLKLEKMAVPSDAEIEALPHDDLVVLTKQALQRIEVYQGILFRVRRQIFGSRSERERGSPQESSPAPETSSPQREATKQLSRRYPEATVEVEHVNVESPPTCPACGATMSDSGMSEDSEYLTVNAREFRVVEQRRHKHRCAACHGAIITAPAPTRLTPGGSYSDTLTIDATLSKYADLIPMGRYCQMAERNGFHGLPPHSLIQASFNLADFLFGVYAQIKAETLASPVLQADETPHRMLEGDVRQRWFLWGFLCSTACFFECHDTRSGDVSSAILGASQCDVLVTDVYSGYKKSLKVANEARLSRGQRIIEAAYCNSHSRRGFVVSDRDDQGHLAADAQWMVDQYRKIYRLEAEAKSLSSEGILEKRAVMAPIFLDMHNETHDKIDSYSSKSQMATAYKYFLNHYAGLTLFLSHPDVPIDNNASERRLRSHVVGRKTWYGTHSKAGAKAAAIHFTLVESCKMNAVNPREYYTEMVRRLHRGLETMTPSRYKKWLTESG